MSIKAYVGRMGSGKTYEVVTSVILPALSRGRRVISNIAGLDYDEFYTVLIEDGVPADKIGKLVQVAHDDVLRPEFWLTDKDSFQERVNGLTDVKTGEVRQCILPGDLIALDENWRFWEGYANKAMPERVMNFFRMHRHFIHHETGVACDVALISQDVMDFSRKVRAVIEESYYMEKLTAVGSTKRYRVDVHQGGKTSRKPLRQLQRSYDSRYFPLYQSHSLKQEGGADAQEENIDDRGNILKGAIFKVGLPLALVMFITGAVMLWRFFNPRQEATTQSAAPEIVQAGVSMSPPVMSKPVVNEQWRVVGYYQYNGTITAMLQNAAGRARVISNPPAYKLSASGLEVELPEGGFVTPWQTLNQSGGAFQ